ncbi:MAG: hypothetical protein WDM77_11835 [Steroidobacteraceae bacterium]
MNLANARPLLVDFGLPPNVDVDAARMLDFARVGMDDLVQTARDGRGRASAAAGTGARRH